MTAAYLRINAKFTARICNSRELYFTFYRPFVKDRTLLRIEAQKSTNICRFYPGNGFELTQTSPKFYKRHHSHPSLPPRKGRVRVGRKISPPVNSYSPKQKIIFG
jgi:hypothetical protein